MKFFRLALKLNVFYIDDFEFRANFASNFRLNPKEMFRHFTIRLVFADLNLANELVNLILFMLVDHRLVHLL